MPASAPLPVLVLQPQLDDGPAYLATWLREHGARHTLCSVAAGDEVPVDASAFAGLALLGGNMSVNDDLPFLHRARALLRSALALGVPVVGHCLGGQLLAQALGAAVTDNPVPEIGWSLLRRSEHPLAIELLGEAAELPAFQWHGQTFALPAGATLLASNAACAHQAFAIRPHIGLQCHIEVDAEKLQRWLADAPLPGDPRRRHASVQGPEAMQAGTARHLAISQATADRLYRHWWAQVLARVAARPVPAPAPIPP